MRRYIEERKAAGGASTVNSASVAGYLTAYNASVPNTFVIAGNSDLKSIELWLENYCSANPLNNLSTGMEHLIDELRP